MAMTLTDQRRDGSFNAHPDEVTRRSDHPPTRRPRPPSPGERRVTLHDEAPHMTRTLLTLLALAAFGTPAIAADAPVTALIAYPAKLTLKGTDDAPQLVLTGKRADGREIDLTGAATYTVSDAKVARVDQNGPRVPARQRHRGNHRRPSKERPSRCRSSRTRWTRRCRSTSRTR